MLIRTKVFGLERVSAPKMGAVAWVIGVRL